ncbi:hypothetical protein [Pseudonocardia hydrocarbonoxydans]|uniref:Uncharacterized protein n=1 Tax=Pseudonocardia hydrocarbonoxydans TaxID=76726 RepID=A0A4Y3WP17_9PSEU|nr:hypothetical protein [Pseudonocardia hydrocarbonoxydans]GEC20534.1 hypothetical protein PHY01_28170 [Pseudonocardia hydrocarbonoxydans]
MTNGNGNYVVLGGGKYPVYVWYDEGTDSIHLTCDDPRLTDENGEKPGFRTVFNANPRSSDYNPGNFNRLARYLAAGGKSAPDQVEMKPRHLARRPQVIAELLGADVTPMAKAAQPAAMGWSVCPTCASIVVDLGKHRAASAGC